MVCFSAVLGGHAHKASDTRFSKREDLDEGLVARRIGI